MLSFRKCFFIVTFYLGLLLPFHSSGQVTLTSAMINSCGIEGDQEFLILSTDVDIDLSLLSIIYSNSTSCTFLNDVFVTQSPPPFNIVNILNGLAGCTAFALAPNPLPAGSSFAIFDIALDPSQYSNWNSFCGGTTYLVFTDLPNAGGNFLNGAGTRYFCLTYDGNPIGTYGFTNSMSSVDGSIATWSGPGTVMTDIPVAPNCSIEQPCNPPVFVNPGDDAVCGSYSLPGISGNFLTGNESYFTGPGGTGTMLNPGEEITTTSTIYIFDPVSPCSTESSFTITINPAPIIDAESNISACPGENISVVFSSTPSGLSFDWTNTNTSIGLGSTATGATGFDFTAAGVTNPQTGTITVTATLSGCTSDPMIFDITVTPLTTLTDPIAPDNTFCNEASAITLPNPIDGVNGVWSGTGVTGNQFDPDGLASGNIILTFTPDAGSCADVLDVPIIIEGAVTPTFDALMDICSEASPIDLPNSSNNGISGTWTFMGNPVTQFDPSGLSGSQTLTFTPLNSECALETTVNINVQDAISLSFSGIPANICASDDPITLPNTSDQGISVSWSGPGVSGTSFNPNGLNGAVELIYTPVGGACVDVDNVIVNITPAITPIFPSLGPFCGSDDPVTLPGVSNNGISGTWSGPGVGGGNIFNPNGLSGTIQLTFEPDGSSCAVNALLPIVVNDAPDITASSNSPVCEGNDLVLSASGGVSYSWSGPNSFSSTDQNPTLTNVQTSNSGTYNVTVTNAGGCNAETSVSVLVNDGFSINTSITNEISCAGANDGAFNVSFSGIPALPLQDISWSVPPGASLNGLGSFSDLPPGVYSIIITDNNGCTAEASLTLGEPDAILLNCTKLNDETAPLAADGSIQVEVSGGTPNYDISISHAGSTPFNNVASGTYIFDNLPPGSYTITITDDNDCTETCVRVINDAGCPTIDIFVNGVGIPQCHDSADGFISISANGGSGTLTYDWSPNPFGINGPDLTDLPGGFYTLIVIDENGCESSPETFDLTPPDPLTITCGMDEPASGDLQNDGVASVFITGGTGNITVVNFTGPGNPTSPVLFQGNNLITDLLPGDYSLAIEDDNGCNNTCFFTIEANVACDLTVDLFITQEIQCNGAADGIISSNVNNGSGNYSFNWSSPAIGNVANAVNVGPGSYSVTVTDIDNPGCTATSPEITIAEPDQIILDCDADPTQTEGGSDGLITLTFSGGTAPYTILWSGPVSNMVDINDPGLFVIENLPEGTYSIQIVDENECIQSCLSTVNSPGCDISVELVASPVSCNGGMDGSIATTVDGANGNVNYQWVAAPTPIPDGTSNPENLTEGVYTLLVTDEANCTATVSTLVSAPNPLQFISCAGQGTPPGQEDGAITINFIGGTGPFTITFTGDGGFTREETQPNSGIYTTENLPAGDYTIVVVDANGCSASCGATVVEINDNCDLNILCSIIQNETIDGNDGIAAIEILPGNQEITLNYFDQLGNPITIGPIVVEDTLLVTDLSPGDYVFLVSNNIENCEVSCDLNVQSFNPPCDFSIMCDPTNESEPDANDGSVIVTISPSNQMVNVSIILPDGSTTDLGLQDISTEFSIEDLEPGDYTITMSLSENCESSCTFTIEEGSGEDCDFEIVFSNQTNVLCHGDSTGSFFVEIDGSFQEPIFVLWAGPPTELELRLGEFNNLPAGNYQIQITDANGCSASGALNITQPSIPFIVSCISQNNGTSVELEWSGASGGIIYHVINVMTNDTIRNTVPLVGTSLEIETLDPGNYEVFLVDENGCQSNPCSFIINMADCELTLGIELVNPISCFGGSDAALQTVVQNAIGNVTYAWDGPIIILDVPNVTDVPAGNYSVTITDEAGCQAEANITIGQPQELMLFDCTSVRPASAADAQDGSARISISGGIPDYIISRTGPLTSFESSPFNGISFTAPALEPGIHVFVVTDTNGCTAECSVEIEIEDIECSLSLTIVEQQDPNCAGFTDGSIIVLGSSDNPMSGNINYLWDSGENSPERTGLGAGIYSVTASDALGCLDSLMISLSEPEEIIVDFALAQADCTQPFSELTISSISGGTGSFNVALDGENYGLPPFPQTIVLDSNSDRNIVATITDENDCQVTFSFDINSFDPLIIESIPDVTLGIGESFEVIGLITNRPIVQITLSYFFNGLLLCDNCTDRFTFQPIESGVFRIVATDSDGCSAETLISITIPEPDNKVFVPNAFTPNGDNINDTFLPFSDGSVVIINYFEILDRWGNVMYAVKDVPLSDGIGWDGRRAGRMLQSGTYIYQLSVQFLNGTDKMYSGEVTLLR